MKNTCKYCDKEFNRKKKCKVCDTCGDKSPLLPDFVKVRDDLRELCGLERMGSKYDN